MEVSQVTLDVDLDVLARLLERMFVACPLTGITNGRERLCKAIRLLMGCSMQAAEQALGAMEFRRQLVFCPDVEGPGRWKFCRAPARC